MNKTNFGLTIKNKALLGCGDFNHTYSIDNTGKRKSAFTAYLSHHLTGKVIVKNDVKVQPQTEDMLQPPMVDGRHSHSVVMQFTPVTDIRIRRKGLSTFQHSPMTKVKYLQTFPQIEEVPKADQTLSFLNTLLRKYRSEFTSLVDKPNKLKDKKVIAKEGLNNYPSRALSKISRLALVGYKFSTGVQSARAFFVRNISMRSHVMARLERDIFICAGNLLSLSTNPFQLCHPYLVVNGKAPISTGVHTHA